MKRKAIARFLNNLKHGTALRTNSSFVRYANFSQAIKCRIKIFKITSKQQTSSYLVPYPAHLRSVRPFAFGFPRLRLPSPLPSTSSSVSSLRPASVWQYTIVSRFTELPLNGLILVIQYCILPTVSLLRPASIRTIKHKNCK